MKLEDKVAAHRKIWGLEDSEREAYAKFKTRILTQLQIGVFEGDLDWRSVRASYCHYHGLHFYGIDYDNYLSEAEQLSRQVGRHIDAASNTTELANVLYGLVVSLEERSNANYRRSRDALTKGIRTAAAISPGVGIRIEVVGSTHKLLPFGAGLLDQEVVSPNLAWLMPFPVALEAYAKALEMRLSGDKDLGRNVLDNMRLAIENVLQGIFKNDKSFEDQQSQLLPWLASKGVHKHTTNLFAGLLFGPYRMFQNDAVKHDSEWVEREVEFHIYLTGTFLRLLLTLHAEQSQPG